MKMFKFSTLLSLFVIAVAVGWILGKLISDPRKVDVGMAGDDASGPSRNPPSSHGFAMFKGGETADGASIDPSHQLADAIGGTSLLARGEIEASDLLTNQVKIAVLHDTVPQAPGGRRPRDFTLDEILGKVDGGEIFFGRGTVAGGKIEWIKFYSGETEVGVIFAADTLEIIATIGDGQIFR